MLQHVALCNKPSGCVCACARQRAREHCVHVSINTQPFLLTHILCSKILSLHFLLNGLAFSPRGAYVVFPSIQRDLSDFSLHCQFGLSWLLIQSCSQACFTFLCQLYKIDPGRVSRPLGSPASARRCCSPPNSSWTLVPLSVYIWRAWGKAGACSHMMFVTSKVIRNEDQVAWRLLEIVMWYKARDSWYNFT